MQEHLLHAYPPNARVQQDGQAHAERDALTTIQNRQPLPNERGSSGCHLRFEHHFVCYLFQVAHGLRLTRRACVFQSINQPRQSRSVGIRFGLRLLRRQGPSRPMTAYAVY